MIESLPDFVGISTSSSLSGPLAVDAGCKVTLLTSTPCRWIFTTVPDAYFACGLRIEKCSPNLLQSAMVPFHQSWVTK